MKESVIQAEIIRYLKMRDVKFNRNNQLAGSVIGIEDITVCYKGFYIAIEVKKPKGSVISPAQEINKNKVLNNGGYHIYATSYKDVCEVFKEIDIEKRKL